ncbi:hypothetical protein MMC22_000598 [Lobaria immixta]|nr:hypothetical protein [Lobaria immixta]
MDSAQYPPEYLAEDQSQPLIILAITFAVLETLFIGLFSISRYINNTAYGMDTYLMFPAYIMCVSHAVLDILLVKTGAGRHAVALAMEEVVMWLKLTLVAEFTYPLSVTLPKLAILCLYLRVFTAKSFRYMCFAVIGIITLSYLATLLCVCISCTPFAYNWNKTIPGGHCRGLIQLYRWPSVPNVVTDLAILLMPLPTIWRLHTSVNQKIGLTMTFLTGSIGIVTAIVRLAVFFTTDLVSDQPWHSIKWLTMTTIEPGIYLIAACLPSLRPLFRKFFRDSDFGTIWARIRSYDFKLPKQTNDSQAISLNAINADQKTTAMVVDPSPDLKQLEENHSSRYSGDDRRGFMA